MTADITAADPAEEKKTYYIVKIWQGVPEILSGRLTWVCEDWRDQRPGWFNNAMERSELVTTLFCTLTEAIRYCNEHHDTSQGRL